MSGQLVTLQGFLGQEMNTINGMKAVGCSGITSSGNIKIGELNKLTFNL